MTRPRIAVVGGGITGLAAAYEIRDAAEVTIFESEERVGGKVATEELDGIQIEAGPDSLLARDEEPIELLTELGLGDDIVEPTNFGAWIAIGSKLKRLPEGFVFGVPASPVALVTSGLLSPGGMLRASADLFRPRTRWDGDIAVGALIRSRFGDQMADRIVAPLVSGIRSGDIDEMSLDMAAPQIAAAARSNRSLTLGLRRIRRSALEPRFIGLRRGMSSLVDALRDASRAEVRLSTRVDRIGEDVTIGDERFDGAVIAVPPHASAPMLGFESLPDTPFADSAVFNLVYPPGSVEPPRSGSGVLVPPDAGRALVACTWVTSKWPHLAPGDGRVLLRCVARGAGTGLEAVVADIADILRVSSAPVAHRAHRWTSAFPEFKVGHRSTVEGAFEALRDRPLRLAGAGYLATGLNDCLAHGRAAAREVVAVAGRRLTA